MKMATIEQMSAVAHLCGLRVETQTIDGSVWVYKATDMPDAGGRRSCHPWNPLLNEQDSFILSAKLMISVIHEYSTIGHFITAKKQRNGGFPAITSTRIVKGANPVATQREVIFATALNYALVSNKTISNITPMSSFTKEEIEESQLNMDYVAAYALVTQVEDFAREIEASTGVTMSQLWMHPNDVNQLRWAIGKLATHKAHGVNADSGILSVGGIVIISSPAVEEGKISSSV